MNEKQKKQFIQATTVINKGLSMLEDMYFEYDGFDELNKFQEEITDRIFNLEKKWIEKNPLTLENAPMIIERLKGSMEMMTELEEIKMTRELIRSLEKFINSGEISDKDKKHAEECFHFEFILEIRNSIRCDIG